MNRRPKTRTPAAGEGINGDLRHWHRHGCRHMCSADYRTTRMAAWTSPVSETRGNGLQDTMVGRGESGDSPGAVDSNADPSPCRERADDERACISTTAYGTAALQVAASTDMDDAAGTPTDRMKRSGKEQQRMMTRPRRLSQRADVPTLLRESCRPKGQHTNTHKQQYSQ